MATQRQGENMADPSRKQESKDQEAHYQFCGHELTITRDLTNDIGLSSIIWDTAIVLCRYFEKERINFDGKKVIELGSGTGLVGILGVLLGGDVTLTDVPPALNQIRNNVASNVPPSAEHRWRVAALSWGKNHQRFPSDYDVILGSDVVYSSREFPLLTATLLHLSNAHTVIYLCSKMRDYMGAMDFHEKFLPEHFDSEIIHRVPEKDINLFKISKRYPVAGQHGGVVREC